MVAWMEEKVCLSIIFLEKKRGAKSLAKPPLDRIRTLETQRSRWRR